MKLIRKSYEVIKKKYDAINKDNVRLTQSSLIAIQAIKAGTDTYRFPILDSENNPAPFADEIRLNINDEFISYDIGYYVSATMSTGTGSTAVKRPYWLTYAPLEFSSKFLQLAGAWYGTLQVEVNKITRLLKWDLKKHNIIPRTQFANSSVVLPVATQSSLDYSDAGMFPMQPMLTFSGAKKNEITVQLVGAIDLTSAIDWTLPDASLINIAADRLVLVFRGMLAQNASSFQK